jgi:hypothetical protein
LAGYKVRELFEQAKKMEKEHIVNAHFEGQCDETEGYPMGISEQYYNKTLKQFNLPEFPTGSKQLS